MRNTEKNISVNLNFHAEQLWNSKYCVYLSTDYGECLFSDRWWCSVYSKYNNSFDSHDHSFTIQMQGNLQFKFITHKDVDHLLHTKHSTLRSPYFKLGKNVCENCECACAVIVKNFTPFRETKRNLLFFLRKTLKQQHNPHNIFLYIFFSGNYSDPRSILAKYNRIVLAMFTKKFPAVEFYPRTWQPCSNTF